MRLILLLILSTLIWCGEPITPAAQKALDTYTAKVSAEQQKFLAAVQKLQVECRRVLEAEQVALTKKGDLEGALAVKAKIEELQKLAVQDDMLGGLVAPGMAEKLTNRPLPAKTLLLQSKWRIRAPNQVGHVQTYAEDGTFTTTDRGAPWASGKWQLSEIKKDQILTLEFIGGEVWKFTRKENEWVQTNGIWTLVTE